MKRVVIIGDSLSMPRPNDFILYEDTYPYLLQQRYEVINRSRRANDTKQQSSEQNLLDDIELLNPDIVIIYLGIVDCAPRLFTKNESRILSLIPSYLRNKIVSLFSKKRMLITKIRKISYVDKYMFKKNLLKIIERIGSDRKIIFINIKECKKLDEKSFSFNKQIRDYNNIISEFSKKSNVNLIDVNHLNITYPLLDDNIHISKEMHLCLHDKILDLIND